MITEPIEEVIKVFFLISEKAKEIDLKPFEDALNHKNIQIQKVKWPTRKTKFNTKKRKKR